MKKVAPNRCQQDRPSGLQKGEGPMKRIILAALVGVLVSGLAAKAEEMTPLQDFIGSNPALSSDNSTLYIFYRCTALFTVMMALSPPDAVSKVLKPRMYKFMAGTIKLQSKIARMSQGVAEERVMKTLKPIGSKYLEAANKNYVNRGHYVGGALINGDLQFCGAIKL